MRALAILALVITVGASVGCGHASGPAAAMMAEMDRVRVAPGAREGAELAPQEYGHAEQERALSRKAYDDGDEAAAALYAERAIAAYQHALVLARLARATKEIADATDALGRASEQGRTLAVSRAEVERDADDLDKKLKIRREALAPAPSGRADPVREAARLVAARALVTQARLLCGAARLLAPAAAGLGPAEKDVTTLDAQLDKGGASGAWATAPIDASARARAACLTLLTKARRAGDGTNAGDADALLSELAAGGGWDPSRDERGVVVTLRGAFNGTTVTPEGAKRFAEIGRVAAAHPQFALQVVVHDASSPSAADAAADLQRAEAAVSAIVAAGATPVKVKSELAGAHAPNVDPADAQHRARNARIEVVFIAPGG